MADGAEPTDAAGLWQRLFTDSWRWADMDPWHRDVAEIRRDEPVLEVDIDGYERFWVLTRHAHVLAVFRSNNRWLNTSRSVLPPDEDWQRQIESGMPEPRTLVHPDGGDHRAHRLVTNDWFKPAVVGTRQPRIDEIADLSVQRTRDLGGACDFAHDIAQRYTLRRIMDLYGVPESDEALMLDLTAASVPPIPNSSTTPRTPARRRWSRCSA